MKRVVVLSKRKPKNKTDLLAILLKNRGIKKVDEKDFLDPDLDKVTLESVNIDDKSVLKAVKRIKGAVDKNEEIVIFGDYDVDGICGTAILWETIYSLYRNVYPHIPHRIEEGYGLSINGIDQVLLEHPETKLIITVDNGIVANDAVAYAAKKGIDVIITDHHVASDKKPNALSIIHSTKICGTSVAFLFSKEIAPEFVGYHLELVALATVADLVPLVGANRTLLKFGLEKLKSTTRPGLIELFREAGIKREDIDSYRIGHVIAPRLNASGRITHALDSLRLICTKQQKRAEELAHLLGSTNRDRQLLTEESVEHANLVTEVNNRIIFSYDKKYNPGIIGLIASRLVEKHYKPSIVVSVGEEYSKGSARSVAGFNIIEFLRTFEIFMKDVGGHPMAAGFTIKTSRIEQFKVALIESGNKLVLDEHLDRILKVDTELDFKQIDPQLVADLKRLEPYGMGNPAPLFISKGAAIENLRYIGRDNNHLKLQFIEGRKKIDGIFFRADENDLRIGDLVDVVYSVDENEWNGNITLQLNVKNIVRQN
ncbi:MAG TPA: single-stranded-DNA-specific exonuclease RecJ [Patescibacteria group bacterium]|nr:single-stranded-DNA-specific exonuclease RecJ [Patescibacteria group bacterium]